MIKKNFIDSKFIEKNTRVWSFTIICKGAKIGDDCNIC
jgi:UDP-3-O-[3-hydroxymyristoyl] glucosamine N-acyltransferase